MAELGAFFGNPNLQRQGARARALAGQRDVNTLADPRTYAIVQGLLGTRPDEMGFSVLNPDYEKIKKVAEPAFALGLLGQAAPLLAPLTKGLPVGASIQDVGGFFAKKAPSQFVPNVEAGKEMIVHHNLSPEKLARVEKVGGMPVPSIAVSNVENPLSSFGNISLIGDKSMAVPSAKKPVYGINDYTA